MYRTVMLHDKHNTNYRFDVYTCKKDKEMVDLCFNAYGDYCDARIYKSSIHPYSALELVAYVNHVTQLGCMQRTIDAAYRETNRHITPIGFTSEFASELIRIAYDCMNGFETDPDTIELFTIDGYKVI